MSSVSCVRLAAVNRQELSDLLKNNLKIWYWKNITGHVCGYMLTVTPMLVVWLVVKKMTGAGNPLWRVDSDQEDVSQNLLWQSVKSG